jgi:hypothetical protein
MSRDVVEGNVSDENAVTELATLLAHTETCQPCRVIWTIKILRNTPFAGQPDAALVAADYLEEEGRERDAAFLRQIHGEGS